MDPEGHTSDNEGVKMALESLFSDPVLEEGLDPGCDKKLNIDDIPETVRPILLDKWQRLRSKLDHARPRGSGSSSARNEEYYQNIEEKLSSVEAELKAKTMETEESAKRIEEFHTEGVMNRQKFTELEQEHQRISSENMTLREDQDRKTREIADLSDVGKRREEELQRMDQELKRIGQELANANAAKCDALIRAEEVAAKEISLTYREKRLEDDRELMQQHINTLTEDLHVATEKANNCKREQISRVSQLQTTLEEKVGYIRLLEGKEEALNGDKEVIQARLDSLCERLKEARDSNSNLEEGYNDEIRAQTNLVSLYKSKASDAEEKSGELAKAVEELQGLLKQSSERYGALEDNLEKEKEENKQEIQRRNEAIRGLKKELEDANELIKSLKQRGLTEEGINQLSPAAAAASKLIKSGMSLTQVYTQLVSCQEELLNAKDENRQLNTYVEQILSDIEERAPAFKRQRDEHENALETINKLEIELKNEKQLHESEINELETVKRRCTMVTKENERSKKQVKDLSTQVVTLVREVEAARFGRTTKGETMLTSPGGSQAAVTEADGVISERLVSFHDVSQLQQKNVELLTVIREMAANQEMAETQLVEEKTADLKKELDNVTSRVEELREARRRQETLMDNLVVQRDMYKSMAESNAEQLRASPKMTSTPSVNSTAMRSSKDQQHEQSTPTRGQDKNAYRDLEVRASKAEAALGEVKKDFDIYREEKCEHEKMITEMLDKTREDLNETRAKVIKFSSQEEWNTERFRLAQNNAANHKKEIGLLEERNKTLHSVIAKHENAIDALHKEMLNSQTMLSKVERSNERLQNEARMLKISESRLQQECEILHRQKTGSALIAENLKMVQVQIEKGESETKMRLENENSSLQKEVQLLRKKLDNEIESYRSSVQAWESSEKELRDQIQTMREKDIHLQKSLEESMAATEGVREQLKLTENKLAETQVMLGGTEEQSATSTTDSQITELKNQIIVLKNESVNLKEHLSKARNATEQYKRIADAAEKQVFDSNTASKQLQSSLMQQIQQLKNDIEVLNVNVQKNEKEKEDIRKNIADASKQMTSNEAGKELITLKEDLNSSNAMLAGFTQEMESLRQSLEIKETELKNQEKIAIDVQGCYERELANHGKTTQNVIKLRGEISHHNQIIEELSESKKKAELDLIAFKEESSSVQNALKEEHKLLTEQFDVVEENNKHLYNQLSNISQQMTSLRESGSSTIVEKGVNIDTNIPGSSNSEETASTNEQFMEIIKYLRKEKAILTGKIEVVVAESSRIKAQFDATSNQLGESRTALQLASDKLSSGMLPSTRFEELMEKVEAIPAIKDSNKVLREDNSKQNEHIKNLQKDISHSKSEIEPLKAQIATQEEVLDKQKSEISALMADNQKWRTRVSGLIEKHQKINPEELKKIQMQNSQLGRQNLTLQNQMKQQTAKHSEDIAKVKREYEANKSALSLKIQEADKSREEGRKKALEDIVNTKKDIEDTRTKLAVKVQEVDKITKESHNNKVLVTKLKNLGKNLQEKNKVFEKEIENYKKQLNEKDSMIKELKTTSKKVETSEETSNTETLGLKKKIDEAEKLIEESAGRISELEEEQKETSKTKNEVSAKLKEKEDELNKLIEKCSKAEQKEQRARTVLINAKEKMTALTEENNAYKREMESTPDATRLTNHQLNQQIIKLNQELQSLKEGFETEKQQLINEYQKQVQQSRGSMDPLSEQPRVGGDIKSQANITASVKPVMASSSMTGTSSNQQSGQRKQSAVQPQAHITPLSRQTHVSAQTATIRPTAMRTQNVVRAQQAPSSNPTSGTTPEMPTGPSTLPHVSVQPTIVSVVGPTSSSASSATSASHRMNPLAAEFISRGSNVSTGAPSPATSSTNLSGQQTIEQANIESSEDIVPLSIQGTSNQTPRPGKKVALMVPPRQSGEESLGISPTPSTSGTAMVSVAPKRRREEADLQQTDNQKKLRHESVASSLNEQESAITVESISAVSHASPSYRMGMAASSTVQGEDDVVAIDSNSGTEDEEEVDEEEEQNESREQMDDEEEHEYDEEDTNVDEEEEVEEEESELVEEGRENITLEDDAESEIQEEEQDERDEVDEGEEEDEEDVMDEDNEENEADSIGQDQQADVSDGEIIDDEVGGSAEVAQAVEAAMVAARRQVQENPPRDDDIVVLESSEDEDEEGIDDANDDDRGDNNKNVIRPEDENPQEGMEDVIEDQESPQLQFPEQSDDRRSNAAVRRDALMDAGGNSVVPEFGDMTATSSQRITVDSLQDSGIPQYQAHIPESSSNVVASGSRHGREAQGGNQFEDGRDDSVVPSTPKLGDGVLHSSQGVPGSSSNMNVIPEERSASGSLGAAPFGAGVPSTFVFGAHPNVRRETLGTSNVTSSSNRSTFDITSGPSGSMSDLAMHHGLDRTSIDFAQFTTSQAHVAQNQPTSGHDVNTMISSATSSQSSVGIPSPSTSRGEIQIQEDVEENVVVQEPTQHGQSSEIVTSSSGSANAGNQQLPGDTSSSQTHVAPPQQNPRGRSTSQQRRGIQRQPIVWDNAPNRNQAAQPPRNQAAQPPPVAASRGLHVPPRQRGGPRGRRPSRMFGAGRRGPRGGAS